MRQVKKDLKMLKILDTLAGGTLIHGMGAAAAAHEILKDRIGSEDEQNANPKLKLKVPQVRVYEARSC